MQLDRSFLCSCPSVIAMCVLNVALVMIAIALFTPGLACLMEPAEVCATSRGADIALITIGLAAVGVCTIVDFCFMFVFMKLLCCE